MRRMTRLGTGDEENDVVLDICNELGVSIITSSPVQENKVAVHANLATPPLSAFVGA